MVLTTYNRKYEVRRALDSVYAQSVMPSEIILVDDMSSDGTKEYIASFSFDKLRYIEMNEHGGCGAARNCGIRHAKGKYIAFLDSDNEWYKNKIEEFCRRMDVNPGCDVYYSLYKKHIEFDFKIFPESYRKAGLADRDEILISNPADASASVYKKDFLIRTGGFAEQMITNIDWELLLRGVRMGEVRLSRLDRELSENWAMYDGLSEDKEVEFRERLRLTCEYKNEIVSSGNWEEHYLDYLRYANGLSIQEADAVNELLHANGYSSDLIKLIFSYHRNLEKQNENAMNRKASFYYFMCDWMQLKLNGSSVAQNLQKEHCKSIAVYGAGKHGKFLYQELLGSPVKVEYFIDRNKEALKDLDIMVYTLEEELPKVDAVVVSPYLEIVSIRQELEKKGDFKIIALNELVKR